MTEAYTPNPEEMNEGQTDMSRTREAYYGSLSEEQKSLVPECNLDVSQGVITGTIENGKQVELFNESGYRARVDGEWLTPAEAEVMYEKYAAIGIAQNHMRATEWHNSQAA